MLTAACQWHPGATARSASTTCTCAAPVAWTIEPRNHAGPQHCTHRYSRKEVMVPTSDGMVPVSEFSANHLQHVKRRHCRRTRGENAKRAVNPLAGAT